MDASDSKKDKEVIKIGVPAYTANVEDFHVHIDWVGTYMGDEIVAIKDGSKTRIPGNVCINFRWAKKGVGFGEYKIRIYEDGKVIVEDAETFGLDFLKEILQHIADKAEFAEDPEVSRAKAEAVLAKLRGEKVH